MTPTLSSGINLLRLEQYEAERQAPDVKMLPGFYGDVIWHPVHGLPIFRNMGAADFRNGREAVKRKLELTNTLWRAGVSLRLGTDVQQPFAVPGVSLHREMSAFEEAGVPRAEVWKLASLDAARALGLDNSGKFEPGMRADVVISRTSPLEAAWTPKQISAVVAGGNLMRASDLDASIDKELGRFKGAVSRLTSRWLAQFAIARLARRYVP
jgi:Amidohydrolase family